MPDNEKITYSGGMLNLPYAYCARLMEKFALEIKKKLRPYFNGDHRIHHALLVGGFSKNEVFTEHLNKVLRDLSGGKLTHWLQPPNVNVAILNGACDLGINPKLITERKAKHYIAYWTENVLRTIVTKGEMLSPSVPKVAKIRSGEKLKFYSYESSREKSEVDDEVKEIGCVEIIKPGFFKPVNVEIYCRGVIFWYEVRHKGEILQEGVITTGHAETEH